MKYSEIEDKATSVLLQNKLLSNNNFEIDLYSLLDKLSIRIQKKPLSGEGVSGILIVKDGRVSIGVDSDQVTERQRFTIAHELGHYFLHSKFKDTFIDEIFTRSGNSNQVEREANAFAAALLMPKELITEAIIKNGWDNNLDDDKIISLAKLFNVSGISMTYRLVNLNIIEQPYY